jgi:hypothetical protein
MDEQDAYFTHAIVGAPFSLLMGRRMDGADLAAAGLVVEPDTGTTRLSPAWQAWAIDRAQDWPAGVPRRRPRGLRRWLERHAIGLALLGLVSLATGCGLAVWALNGMQGWPA